MGDVLLIEPNYSNKYPPFGGSTDLLSRKSDMNDKTVLIGKNII